MAALNTLISYCQLEVIFGKKMAALKFKRNFGKKMAALNTLINYCQLEVILGKKMAALNTSISFCYDQLLSTSLIFGKKMAAANTLITSH